MAVATLVGASALPYYQQLAALLRNRILGGHYRPGQRIETEEELAQEHQVSRATVRQALAELVREQLVVQRRGSGTFHPSFEPDRLQPLAFTGFLDDLFLQTTKLAAADVELREVPAPPGIAAALGLSEPTLMEMRHVRLLDGIPLTYTVNFLPLGIGHQLRPAELTEFHLLDQLEALGYRLVEAFQTVEARTAEPWLAERLAVVPGAPTLYVERTLFTEGGRPIEHTHTHYRGDRYQYAVRLCRLAGRRRGRRRNASRVRSDLVSARVQDEAAGRHQVCPYRTRD